MSETSQSVVNAAAAGGGSMRSFKKFRDYALQSHNKSKEKAGGDPNLQHLLQPTPELDEVTRGLQVPQAHILPFPFLSFVSQSGCTYVFPDPLLLLCFFLPPPLPLGVFLELGFTCMRLLGYFTASLGILLDDGRAGSSFVLKNQDLMSRPIIF